MPGTLLSCAAALDEALWSCWALEQFQSRLDFALPDPFQLSVTTLVVSNHQAFPQALVRFSVCLALIWMLWKSDESPSTCAQLFTSFPCSVSKGSTRGFVTEGLHLV